MRKTLFGLSAAMMLSAANTHAVPTLLDPSASLLTFDTGGILDPGSNGGLTLGGLEVDASGTVFVLGASGAVGGASATVQLFKSTGLGTASSVGAPVPFALNTRGFDLTENPGDGKMYAAGTLGGAAPTPGIHGFDPSGIAAPTTFATTSAGFTTSGLTFNAAGTSALVSTDGVTPPAPALPNGLYSVPSGGPEVAVVTSAALPTGIGPTDDHVITLDGRTIVVGDGSHDLWDVTGGAGTVSLLIDLDLLGLGTLGVGGNRAAVDPWSGDIFVGWGLPATSSILRVKADGSGASVFATGVAQLRDLDFGISSSGSGASLYVAEVSSTGVGTIYEFALSHAVPEPTTLLLLGLGLAGLGFARKRLH